MKYRINEIFHSLQGEGRFTGTPVIFVRFSGCNLQCSFCDTKFDSYTEYTGDELLSVVKKYPCKRIVFTGGEPTLQIDQELFNAFKNEEYKLHIETNGTNIISFPFDWITVSPKEKWIQKKGNELKVVYTRQELNQYFTNTKFKYRYLQPCSMKNTKEVIKIILEDSRWKLSLQTQKMLNIR